MLPIAITICLVPCGHFTQYRFVEDQNRYVGIVREYIYFSGRLKMSDANLFNGVLHERGTLIGKLRETGDFDEYAVIREGESAAVHFEIICKPQVIPVDAYELRSGRLLRGQIDKLGNFVPLVKSRTIKFSDYNYSPGAIPIWNLPGRFVKVE
jgi:hypothetical protein